MHYFGYCVVFKGVQRTSFVVRCRPFIGHVVLFDTVFKGRAWPTERRTLITVTRGRLKRPFSYLIDSSSEITSEGYRFAEAINADFPCGFRCGCSLVNWGSSSALLRQWWTGWIINEATIHCFFVHGLWVAQKRWKTKLGETTDFRFLLPL